MKKDTFIHLKYEPLIHVIYLSTIILLIILFVLIFVSFALEYRVSFMVVLVLDTIMIIINLRCKRLTLAIFNNDKIEFENIIIKWDDIKKRRYVNDGNLWSNKLILMTTNGKFTIKGFDYFKIQTILWKYRKKRIRTFLEYVRLVSLGLMYLVIIFLLFFTNYN